MADESAPPPPPPRTEAEDVTENGGPEEEEEEEDAPMPAAPPAVPAAPAATVAAVAVAAPAQTGGGKRSPSDFLKTVLGRSVVVKLNSGIDYRGERAEIVCKSLLRLLCPQALCAKGSLWEGSALPRRLIGTIVSSETDGEGCAGRKGALIFFRLYGGLQTFLLGLCF